MAKWSFKKISAEKLQARLKKKKQDSSAEIVGSWPESIIFACEVVVVLILQCLIDPSGDAVGGRSEFVLEISCAVF